MSKAPAMDAQPHLAAVAAVGTMPGQPQALFAALDAAMGAVLGHRLFTMMRYHAVSGESERIYTTHPREYPVGGRKMLNVTPWAERVLKRQQPYLGRTPTDVQSVFFDHALIASLGCGSVLNLPVVWNGRTLGTINLLHEARWYGEEDVPLGQVFAALAVPAFRLLSR